MAKRKIHLDLTPPVYTKDETEYTPIHLHSGYSTYDGVAPIKEMVECAVSLGMSALSISDHGNMSGVFSFNNECKANNIKPVIGCEFYVNPEREPEHKNTRNQHLCLFAMNEVGYKNLLKITYIFQNYLMKIK